MHCAVLITSEMRFNNSSDVYTVSSSKCQPHKMLLMFYLSQPLQQPWWGSPGGSDGKESACSAGDPGAIPGSGRFLAGGHGHPLQFSCLENPMDRGAWWAIVASGVPKELDTTERPTLSHFQSSPRSQGIAFCPFL